jgi:hypothetical protein
MWEAKTPTGRLTVIEDAQGSMTNVEPWALIYLVVGPGSIDPRYAEIATISASSRFFTTGAIILDVMPLRLPSLNR